MRCMAWCSGGRSAKCTTAMWRRGRSARRGTEAQRRAGVGARPPVLRTHPLVASLDELPPTVTRGEETTPTCERCVREDHPSTHAPPLLATRSHTVSSSQAVCWECPSAVGRSIASRVSKVDSGMHEPGEASQREHGDAGDHQRPAIEGPASFPRRSNPEEPRHGGFHSHGGQGEARRGIIPRFSMLSAPGLHHGGLQCPRPMAWLPTQRVGFRTALDR